MIGATSHFPTSPDLPSLVVKRPCVGGKAGKSGSREVGKSGSALSMSASRMFMPSPCVRIRERRRGRWLEQTAAWRGIVVGVEYSAEVREMFDGGAGVEVVEGDGVRVEEGSLSEAAIQMLGGGGHQVLVRD